MEGDPGLHSGVAVEEFLHGPGIARENNQRVFPVVLHLLDYRVDGLVSVAALEAVAEGICLVNEKHSALGFPESLLDYLGCLTDVGAYKIGSSDLDEAACGKYLLVIQDFGAKPCNSGLCGTGVAGEDHVHRASVALDAPVHAELVELELGDGLGDDFLGGFEADHGCKFRHCLAVFADVLEALIESRDISGSKVVELILGDARSVRILTHQPSRLVQECLVDEVSDKPSVAEILEQSGPVKEQSCRHDSVIRSRKAALAEHVQEDLCQFVSCVIGKIDPVGNPALEALVEL